MIFIKEELVIKKRSCCNCGLNFNLTKKMSNDSLFNFVYFIWAKLLPWNFFQELCVTHYFIFFLRKDSYVTLGKYSKIIFSKFENTGHWFCDFFNVWVHNYNYSVSHLKWSHLGIFLIFAKSYNFMK